MTRQLFQIRPLGKFLTERSQDLEVEIRSLSDNRLLSGSQENLCDVLVRKYSLSAPRINESGIQVDIASANLASGQQSANHFDEPSGPASLSGTRIYYSVPFTGDRDLLECRPSKPELDAPYATVRSNELAFLYLRLRDAPDTVEKDFERDLECVKKYLAWIARDLDKFNSSIRQKARDRITAKHQELHDHQQLAERLGFPTRRATDVPDTPARAQVEHDAVPQASRVATAPETPQPSFGIPEITHSPDYKTLIVDGQKLRMRSMAVRTIHFIYTEWMRTGNPDVDEGTVLKNIPTQQDSLYKAVRHGRRRIWNKMIGRGNAKGTVRLILSAFVKNA